MNLDPDEIERAVKVITEACIEKNVDHFYAHAAMMLIIDAHHKAGICFGDEDEVVH